MEDMGKEQLLAQQMTEKYNQSINPQVIQPNQTNQLNETVVQQQPTPPPNSINSSFGVCSQCGLIHPPMTDGKPCPSGPVKISEEKTVDLSGMLINLKNIFSSQIQSKKIKDPEKLFKLMTVEITKFLEKYKEK